MEDELKCPVCKQFFQNPVLLPCFHNYCLQCAQTQQITVGQLQTGPNSSSSNSSDISDAISVCVSDDSSDKLSMLSETDSGVVCNSRPNSSYFGGTGITPPPSASISSSLNSNALCISCLVCRKICYFDDAGPANLPRNRALANLVQRFLSSRCPTPTSTIYCQLCEVTPAPATVMCEQCEVFYCQQCQISCHPPRGPLAKHSLMPAPAARLRIEGKLNFTKEATQCWEHLSENLTMYCMVCKCPVCCMCLQDGRHSNHDVQSLGSICKTQKVK